MTHRTYDTYEYLHEQYVENGRSTGSIAKEHGTYANTIRRCLKKHGIKLRTKSQAQKNFLSENEHPMAGKTRSPEERKRISEGIQNYFDSLTEEEINEMKASMSERAIAKWESMSSSEKEASIHKMHVANRMSSRGSKNENLVAKLLAEAGYKIVQRTKEFSPRNEFEIDIAIPSESVAIEWDGAAHYEPIFGDDSLQKTMEKDERKNKVLTKYGWTLIRCRDYSTAHSLAFCRRAVNKIIDVIRNGEEGKVHYIEAE